MSEASGNQRPMRLIERLWPFVRRSRVAKLIGDLVAADRRIEELEGNIASLRTHNDWCNADLIKAQGEIGRLRERVAIATEERDAAVEANARLLVAESDKDSEITRLKARVIEVEAMAVEAWAENDRLMLFLGRVRSALDAADQKGSA